MNPTDFIKHLEQARAELWKAHNLATDNNEWHRANLVMNALEELHKLLYIEWNIRKQEQEDKDETIEEEKAWVNEQHKGLEQSNNNYNK